MPDITMCKAYKCPKAKECTRYMAEPNPYRQSYFMVIEHGEEGCEYFWPVKESPYKLKEPSE